jgi:hypothetical protein
VIFSNKVCSIFYRDEFAKFIVDDVITQKIKILIFMVVTTSNLIQFGWVDSLLLGRKQERLIQKT